MFFLFFCGYHKIFTGLLNLQVGDEFIPTATYGEIVEHLCSSLSSYILFLSWVLI